MSNNQTSEPAEELKKLAIEGELPLKTIGIENLKESNPKHKPPQIYLHPWFARRPTPVSRLAVLASILPESVSSDQLLKWMQIGPKHLESGIAEHVESKKATEASRSGNFEEHYGYPRPFRLSPSKSEISELHQELREHWDGELPTVLDPTAGGGVIPFEALRYNLPVRANELNPIPALILKVMLEYAPEVGSLREELEHWGGEINEIAKERIQPYFPSKNSSHKILNSACTFTVPCDDCGCDIPLVSKWWLYKDSAREGVAVRPSVNQEENTVEYEVVRLPDDVTKDEFDPQKGVVDGSATCLNCSAPMDSTRFKEKMNEGDFEYELLGVKYEKAGESQGSYRAPTLDDEKAMEKAAERIRSDIDLATFLTTDIPEGNKTSELLNWGITEWREVFSPRQLITHYEYLQAFEECRESIENDYDEETAEAILTLLSLIASKSLDRNSILSPWSTKKGYPENAMGGKNYPVQRLYVENNLTEREQGYLDILEKITDSYEELAGFADQVEDPDVSLSVGDAADLPYDAGEISAAVIDPPYYTSIMYSELSDFFYVWLREYLGEIYPDTFRDPLTNKEEEAVANPSRFESVATGEKSSKELADEYYEQKMSDIFSEVYRTLERGGVMTVMFTHKETDAWDTLTMSLINSGFTITSTHPITSEMPQRLDTRGGGSADSTLLLTGRKPQQDRDPESSQPTLWDEVKKETRATAKDAARDLLDSGLSLTKTDVIISAFGPTLGVYADNYPVVDDEGNEVRPREALTEAREAVTQVLVDTYLEGEGIDSLDEVTKWYILSWLVHESDTFEYDDGRQLGLGVGIDIDDVNSKMKVWRKGSGNNTIQLRSHDDVRVQDVNKPPESRSSRRPVNPDDMSYSTALDAVHAAMHVYEAKGETEAWNWMNERNLQSNSDFRSTLTALLQVLPSDHEDWELARDLAVGKTGELLDLDLDASVFQDERDEGDRQGNLSDF